MGAFAASLASKVTLRSSTDAITFAARALVSALASALFAIASPSARAAA